MSNIWTIIAIISFLVFLGVPIVFFKNSHRRRNERIKSKLLIGSFVSSGLFSLTIIGLDIWLIFYVYDNATYFGLQPDGLFGLNICALIPILALNIAIFILSLKEYLLWRKCK